MYVVLLCVMCCLLLVVCRYLLFVFVCLVSVVCYGLTIVVRGLVCWRLGLGVRYLVVGG